MAATVNIDSDIEIGGTKHLYELTVTVGAYVTGGVAVDVAGNTSFSRLLCGGVGGYGFEFIPSTQKLKVYRQKDPANAGGADIALPEVADTVNLAAVVISAIAIGS